jgi:enoyl-CoA hydratase
VAEQILSRPASLPILDLTDPDAADRILSQEDSGRPLLLLSSGPVSLESSSALRSLDSLLRRDGPVLGLLGASLSACAASLFLACDEILWLPRRTLRFLPGPLGETVLLDLRVGSAAAARVWFSGGTLTRREAVRAGWASASAGPLPRTMEEAAGKVEGLSSEALSLLRPLLLREHGLARGPAEALERSSFALLFDSGHPAEGAAAFLEKRKPRFSDE